MSEQWNDLVEALLAANKAGNEPVAEAIMRKLEFLQRSMMPPIAKPPMPTDKEDAFEHLAAGERRRGGFTAYPAREKLMVRMGWPRTSNMPWRLHIDDTGGKVFVFGIKDGEAFTLVDDANMFPSDTLVTQLRMLST